VGRSTTGTSFEYLLATGQDGIQFQSEGQRHDVVGARALINSRPDWLGTVKEAGSQLGYGKYADAITKSPSGNYAVSDPAARDAIMKLRDDPDAASSMAAVLTQSNSSSSPATSAAARPMPNSTWRISWVSAARPS